MRNNSVRRQVERLGLGGIALLVVVLVRGGLRLGAYRYMCWAIVRMPAVLEGAASPVTLARAVLRVDRLVPGTSSCLGRALAVQALCTVFGHETSLRLGVRRDLDAIEGHAWVEHRDGVLVGGRSLGEYVPLEAAVTR